MHMVFENMATPKDYNQCFKRSWKGSSHLFSYLEMWLNNFSREEVRSLVEGHHIEPFTDHFMISISKYWVNRKNKNPQNFEY